MVRFNQISMYRIQAAQIFNKGVCKALRRAVSAPIHDEEGKGDSAADREITGEL